MHKTKRTLLAGAAVAGVGLAGLGTWGVASAATNTTSSSDPQSSLVDKIATKFGLQKSDVQAVFDQNRSEQRATMEAKAKERLAQAVTDGKLTQDQADHITSAMDEIKQLIGDKKPNELDDATKQQVKAKMDALRQWAQDNKLDMSYLRGGFGGPRGGGHMMGDSQAPNGGQQQDPSDTPTDSVTN